MYFVDNGSAVPVMPQVKPVSSATPQFFTEGGNGTPPTYPGPDWFNIFQLELLNVLKEAQIDPDKANHTQLVTAMKKLFLDASSNGSDIPDKAAFLSNLGISSLTSLDTANSKWLWKLPNGVIYQIFKPDAQNSTTSGVSMDNTMTYPVAFPSECFAVLICKTTYIQIIVSAEIATRTQCKVITLPVVTPTVQWSTTTILAIGR